MTDYISVQTQRCSVFFLKHGDHVTEMACGESVSPLDFFYFLKDELSTALAQCT